MTPKLRPIEEDRKVWNAYASPEDLVDLNPYRSPVEVVNIEDLIHRHPTLSPPVIHDLLREREIGNLTAATKTNKSWLGGHAALCIITGLPFLGRFEVSRGKVLLVDNELHPETIAHRIPTIAEAMGLSIDDYCAGLDVISLRGKLRSLQEMGEVFTRFHKGEYKLVILDARYRFAGPNSDENNNNWMANEYNTLDGFAEMLGSAFLIINHASKGDQSGKSISDVGAGAGSQSRACDSHMILRPHEEQDVAVFDAILRSFPPISSLPLRWTFPLWQPDLWVDPSKLAGKQTKSEERQQERDREATRQIVDALMIGTASVRALREKTGLSRERIERILVKMVSEDQVTYQEVNIKGNLTKEYTLVQDVGDE